MVHDGVAADDPLGAKEGVPLQAATNRQHVSASGSASPRAFHVHQSIHNPTEGRDCRNGSVCGGGESASRRVSWLGGTFRLATSSGS